MRRIALASGLMAALLLASPAFAHGPSGSSEEVKTKKGTMYTNNVKCKGGVRTPTAVVYAGANGVEVCTDRGPIPLQGRVILTTAQGGYFAADGDKDNEGPLSGWFRLDRSGPRCGDAKGNLDATHPTSKDTSADCG
jgi:hypothetical protein